jgi:hypothetical protein
LGSGSMTVPSTWMPSSLPEDVFSLFLATRATPHSIGGTYPVHEKRPFGARRTQGPKTGPPW